MVSLIVIQDEEGGIGHDNSIPFMNPADLRNFKSLTLNHVVIMGRKTYDTIGKLLPNRVNKIISTTPGLDRFTFDECVRDSTNKKVFVIGGAQVYKQFLDLDLVDTLYISTVQGTYNCNVKMPVIDFSKFKQRSTLEQEGAVHDTTICYREYTYINSEEVKFLQLLEDIMTRGSQRIDRTLVGTKSVFGRFLEFDLSNDKFPLGTTKKMHLNNIFEELMWFIRGDTNAKTLNDKGIRVWNPNSSRAFLDSRNLTHYKEGDIGPTYGFAFRHYGADYKGCDYTNHKGYDQLLEVIHLIRTNPESRRMLINLWNPTVLDAVALPPCLFCYQFYVTVTEQGKMLDCLMSQRSSDISLAGFWNIATGALLVYLIARVTGCVPHSLKWCIGDAHIYLNQFGAVTEQLKRTPRMFPRLMFQPNAPTEDITLFESSHLILLDYRPHATIKNVLNP
jgi:dihydrofolate reductase/thymidylate synthase